MLKYVKTTLKKTAFNNQICFIKSQNNYEACVFRKSTHMKETFTCKASLSCKHFSFFNCLVVVLFLVWGGWVFFFFNRIYLLK